MHFVARMCIIYSASSDILRMGTAALVEALEMNTTLQSLKFGE
jgi:hypothetical protein